MYPQRPHFQPPRHNLVTKLSLKILSERVFASSAAVDVEDEGVAAAPVTPVTPVATVTVEAVVQVAAAGDSGGGSGGSSGGDFLEPAVLVLVVLGDFLL